MFIKLNFQAETYVTIDFKFLIFFSFRRMFLVCDESLNNNKEEIISIQFRNKKNALNKFKYNEPSNPILAD